eukprot:Gb_31499 [translate_table: standard]
MDQQQLYHYDSKRKRDTFEANGIANAVDLALAEALEKSHGTVEVLDTRGLKQLVLSFEGRLRDNLEAQMKYVDHDSEVKLHEEINKLKALAGALDLHPELVHLNTILSILRLLSHENTDIAVDVVNLLQDLTEEDVLEDSDEAASAMRTLDFTMTKFPPACERFVGVLGLNTVFAAFMVYTECDNGKLNEFPSMECIIEAMDSAKSVDNISLWTAGTLARMTRMVLQTEGRDGNYKGRVERVDRKVMEMLYSKFGKQDPNVFRF